MEKTMNSAKITLGEYLEALRVLEEDRDIYVDGIDGIAYCGTQLSDAGRKHFKKCLSLPMDGACVVSDNEEDYVLIDEDMGLLVMAWRMLSGMAGYCSVENWNKWFI